MIRLSLRFDDPSAISNRVLEEGIFAAVQTAGIPITVAVVPFGRQGRDLIPLTKERVAHLIDAQRAGIIEVAQHGYCHVSARGEKLPRSEFMVVDAACQTEWICAGKILLETVFDKPIIGFVPPWGTFDSATTYALEKLNFRYLSAGWNLNADCSPSLSYVPATCQMISLPNTLNELEHFALPDLVVNAVMHHYDFAESGNPQAPTDLKRFRVLLKALAQHERVLSLACRQYLKCLLRILQIGSVKTPMPNCLGKSFVDSPRMPYSPKVGLVYFGRPSFIYHEFFPA